MRLFASVLLLLSLLGLAAAQANLLTVLPKCSISCFVQAANASTCGFTDNACHCTDAKYTAVAETCVAKSCKIEDMLVVKNVTTTACGIAPHDNAIAYNVIVTVLMILAAVFVAIRVVYKQFLTQLGLGLDDWTIIITILVCVPSAVLNVKLAEYGIGKDIWTLTPTQITDFSFTFWIITLLYFSEVPLLKLSLLFFYLRIFPDVKIRKLLWATVAVDVLFWIAFILAALLQCMPVSYNWTNWNDTEGKGHCGAQPGTVAWAHAAISIALDFWMLYLPLSQVSSLNLHWKKKLGVAAMVVVGTFVTVISIVRLASLVQFRGSSNITYDYWGVSVWSTVEITVGIMCACMPSMRVILVRLWPRIFGGSSYASNSKYGAYGNSSKGGHTGNGSQVDHSSRNRSASNTWKPKFAKQSPPSDGPFGKSHNMSRLERIDSNDDATELRTTYKTHITSSAASEHSSDGERQMSPRAITVSRDVEVRY